MTARRLAVVLAAAVAASSAARAQPPPARRATAATKKAVKGPAPTAPASPVPEPAPERVPAAAQATALHAAAPAGDPEGVAPQPRQAPPAPWFAEQEWRVATLLGAEFGIGDASYDALALRVEAERTVRALSPRAALGWVISAGALHASDSESVTVPMVGAVSMEWRANLFDVVPSARLTYALAPKLWVHGDAGLGVAYTAASGSVDVPGIGPIEPVSGGLAGVLRLAGGLAFAPTPNVRVGAQLVGFDVRFGDGVGSAFSFLLSASHRL